MIMFGINSLDPNPVVRYFPYLAVATRKNVRFSIFFQNRTIQKVLTAYRSPI